MPKTKSAEPTESMEVASLLQAIRRAHGLKTQRALGDRVGLTLSQTNRALAGVSIGSEQLLKVLESIDARIEDALPPEVAEEYRRLIGLPSNPAPDADTPLLPDSGWISSTTGAVSFDSKTAEGADADPDFWKRIIATSASGRARWELTTGVPIAMRVEGEGMDPRFPGGSRLFFRYPREASIIPNGTICIVKEKKSGRHSIVSITRDPDSPSILAGMSVVSSPAAASGGLPANAVKFWSGRAASITHAFVGALV